MHEGVGDADRNVEIGEVAAVLGVDELLHVGMVAAQHAHLRAAARAGRFHRLAGAVEHAHVGYRSARARVRAFDFRSLGADRGKIVADAAAAAHGFRRLLQGGVDAGLVVDDLGDRVAHRLHETVDQGCLHLNAGGRHDAAGGDEAGLHRLHKALFPMRTLVFRFDRSERMRDARTSLMLVSVPFAYFSSSTSRLII